MIVGFYGRVYGNDAKIPLESFYLWEMRAVAALNRFTVRDISEEASDDAKMCICEVAEFLYERSKGDGVVSENNDGYSVHFEKGKTEEGVLEIARKWLLRSGALYRGDVL